MRSSPLDAEWLEAWRRRGRAGEGGAGAAAGGSLRAGGGRLAAALTLHMCRRRCCSSAGVLLDDLALTLHIQLAAARRRVAA